MRARNDDIMQPMRQILNIYRAVKMADAIAEELDKDNPNQVQSSGFQAWDPATAAIKHRITEKYKKISVTNANAILMDAFQLNYLKGFTESHNGKNVDAVHITTKGRGLIDNFLYIPWGLLKAWIEEYGIVFSFIAALGVGVIIRELIRVVFGV